MKNLSRGVTETYFLKDALNGHFFDVSDLNKDLWQCDDTGQWHTGNKLEYEWFCDLGQAYDVLTKEQVSWDFVNDYDDVISLAIDIQEEKELNVIDRMIYLIEHDNLELTLDHELVLAMEPIYKRLYGTNLGLQEIKENLIANVKQYSINYSSDILNALRDYRQTIEEKA